MELAFSNGISSFMQNSIYREMMAEKNLFLDEKDAITTSSPGLMVI